MKDLTYSVKLGSQHARQAGWKVATHTRAFKAYHTVVSGDTLWQLAMSSGATVAELQAWNGLTSDMIWPGQKLVVYEGSQQRYDKLQYQALVKTGVPLALVPVYKAAGRAYDVPWTVLAAIHREETHFSTGPEVSSAGAQGPMQFMPSTFAEYAVRAPGQSGPPDINNVYDAIYTCARMLHVNGYSRSPESALYLYNHSLDYVRAVEEAASSL